MPLPFLDTNIFLRHLTGDVPEQAEKATAYFEKIERGEIKAVTSDIVVFEVVWTLGRYYKKSKQEINDAVLPLLELPHIRLPGKRRLRRVFDLYLRLNIPFADAYHIVFMEQNKLNEIISFDHEFDKVQGINRKEP
jgi:predicted nucleic acid-binding protein